MAYYEHRKTGVAYGEIWIGNYSSTNHVLPGKSIDTRGLLVWIWFPSMVSVAYSRITRKNSSMLVVDEPEIYLHPDVQHQLVEILREAGPDIVAASHSTEIIGEADPTEILLIDKTKRSARRLKEIDQVQFALDEIGSIHNIQLTRLARTGRLLYVEGSTDYKTLRRFSRILGFTELAAGNDITTIESGGFGSWKKIDASAWAFEKVLHGQFKIGTLFDRDYFVTRKSKKYGKNLPHIFPLYIYTRERRWRIIYYCLAL